jgi:hypothetical protein
MLCLGDGDEGLDQSRLRAARWESSIGRVTLLTWKDRAGGRSVIPSSLGDDKDAAGPMQNEAFPASAARDPSAPLARVPAVAALPSAPEGFRLTCGDAAATVAQLVATCAAAGAGPGKPVCASCREPAGVPRPPAGAQRQRRPGGAAQERDDAGGRGRADADAADRLQFADRRKSILRRSGEDIAALEAEGALASHPAVRAVAPAEDAIRGDEGMAIVVPAPAPPAAPAPDLLAHAAERFACF